MCRILGDKQLQSRATDKVSCRDRTTHRLYILCECAKCAEEYLHRLRLGVKRRCITIECIPKSRNTLYFCVGAIFTIKSLLGRIDSDGTYYAYFLHPFCRQNAVDATLGVFRVDGLYSRYCPLRRKRLAAAGTVFSQQNSAAEDFRANPHHR